MDAPVHQSLGQISANLHAINHLPANTYIHKDRNGYFIPTAPNYAWIPGAQSTAKFIKGQTNEQLVADIYALTVDAIHAIDDHLAKLNVEDNDARRRFYRQLFVLNREIKETERDKEGGGGMPGMLKTYAFDQIACSSILGSVKTLCEYSAIALKKAEEMVPSNYVNQIKLCPEDSFTKQEWQEAVKNSHDLKKEYVSPGKYYINYKAAFLWNETMNALDITKVKVGEIVGQEWDASWNWWDIVYIHPNGAKIILGAMPVAAGVIGPTNRNDLKTFKEMGVGAVLTFQEVFENNSQGYVNSPITPKDYEAAGVMQLQIATPDFETMPSELLARGTAFINWCLENGITIYVHCKAGRGRSKLGVDCYLIKYQGFNAQAAYDHVKQLRKQSGYDGDKWESLLAFEKIYGQKQIT